MWTIPILLFGHFLLWLSCFNHCESTSWHRNVRRLMACVTGSCFLAPPIYFFLNYSHWWTGGLAFATVTDGLAAVYLTICLVFGIVGSFALVRQWVAPPACRVLLSEQRERRNLNHLSQPSPSRLGQKLHAIPGNECYQLDVADKELLVRQLPAGLHGLTIAHLSDLHFTGELSQAYYDHIVDEVNERDCDLVVITGDIVDKPDLIQWVQPTLGRLRAKHGVFAILGNHDLKVPRHDLLSALARAEITYLGGSWHTLQLDGRGTIVLAGNELPWIRPAADMNHAPTRSDKVFRVLLSHAPDQLGWAQSHQFDLVLAGHTHGGQIRFPGIGAVISPSRMPLNYASGTFDEGELVMHVSRGLGGEVPIRLRCPPELAFLSLHAPLSRNLSSSQADEATMVRM